MNLLIMYLLLLKATLTSFSGLAGLPVVRHDFIVKRAVITDAQLNAAVAVGRTVPGPNGLYIVCVGYFAAGYAGAAVGTLALMTPAFLAIILLLGLGRHAQAPLVRSIVSAVLLAGSALLISTSLQLAPSAITDIFTGSIAALSFTAMAATAVDTFWVMLAAAAIGLARKLLFG